MERRGIRRVPVVEGGRLHGLVSRADLLGALVEPRVDAADVSDERIRRAVVAAMRREPWADSSYTGVAVQDGVVELCGVSRGEAVQRGLRVLAEQVPGVRGVVDHTAPMPPPAFLYQVV